MYVCIVQSLSNAAATVAEDLRMLSSSSTSHPLTLTPNTQHPANKSHLPGCPGTPYDGHKRLQAPPGCGTSPCSALLPSRILPPFLGDDTRRLPPRHSTAYKIRHWVHIVPTYTVFCPRCPTRHVLPLPSLLSHPFPLSPPSPPPLLAHRTPRTF